MDVTRETQQEAQTRLRSVLCAAEVVWLPGRYAFTETTDLEDAVLASRKALAVVRDENSWSVLSSAEKESAETFSIFTCHFAANLPNSGFVGWLASEIKSELGSGVFVVCGHNQKRGGIFDYWGVPEWVAPDVRRLLETLKTSVACRSG